MCFLNLSINSSSEAIKKDWKGSAIA